jgi:hypothetical protein
MDDFQWEYWFRLSKVDDEISREFLASLDETGWSEETVRLQKLGLRLLRMMEEIGQA